jgi:hypothetical protein
MIIMGMIIMGTPTDPIAATRVRSRLGRTATRLRKGRRRLQAMGRRWCEEASLASNRKAHGLPSEGASIHIAEATDGDPVSKQPDANPYSAPFRESQGFLGILIFPSLALTLSAPVSPAESQPANETIRVENEYRECLYSKTRNGRYARGERDSDFGLIGECRNQWVAYVDVCLKLGFDNATCVMKSRLIIHAILNLTGK